MGRRAADLTTSVPVLGVPALVGVRGWRTTAGERTGGALLQTCGPQSSIGVQTSPGISRLPIQHGVQLTGALSAPSDNVTQTPNSYITRETEYKEISLLTKCDKEKRAILKLKSGESKTKKEVTFKALSHKASKDVTCSQKNSSGSYCYAKAIKTNPLFAGNVTGIKPKLRSTRYTNGSVVDSEAIGGISVHEADTEKRSSTSHNRNRTRLQGFYAERSVKALLVSGARPFRMPQKICSHCGGRQTLIALGDKSYTTDACLEKKGITSLSIAGHLQMPQIERNLKLSHHEISCRDKRMHIIDNQKLLYHSEDLKHRKTPHPACPVHSRSQLVPLLLKHGVSDATSTQPSATLHARTITVTQATIEKRQDDPGTKSVMQPSQGGKIPRPTSLPLTPQMATATKSNNPSSHTYPKHLRVPQRNSTRHNVPQSVCVSVHAIPENTLIPPPSLYTSAAGSGNISMTEDHKKTPVLAAKVATVQHKSQNLKYAAWANTNSSSTPQKSIKCSSISLADNTLNPSHHSETTAQPAPATHPSTPSNQGHKPPEKPSSNTDSRQTVAFTNTGPSTLARPIHAPQPPLSTTVPQRTSYHNSDQIMHIATKHACAVVQNLSTQPKYSTSEPILHVSSASQKATPNGSPLRDLKAGLFSGVAPISTSLYRSILHKSTALRNSSVNLKNPPPTVTASLSALTENQRSSPISGTISLQPTDKTQHSPKLCSGDTNQLGPTRATGSNTQTSNKSGLCSVVTNVQNTSAGNTTALSELLNVSKQHTADGDASIRKLGIIPNSESDADQFIGNLINKLAACESKHRDDANPSQVTGLQNNISLIKSSSSCLQGRINTEQQRLAHCQGYTKTEYEGRCTACPPVKTGPGQDLNSEKFAGGLLVRRADVKFKRANDEQKHHNSPAPLDRTASRTVTLSLEHASPHVMLIPQSLPYRTSDSDPSLPPLAHTSPELSFPPPPHVNSKGELCVRTGPECNSVPPSSTMHLASLPGLQPCQAKAMVRPESKSHPARPQPCPEDTSLAHSHPADAALLLPPSPQCCESASLQQRLETVEASLAANKDRITTLLNIIHDLETCHSPSSG